MGRFSGGLVVFALTRFIWPQGQKAESVDSVPLEEGLTVPEEVARAEHAQPNCKRLAWSFQPCGKSAIAS